MSQEEKLRETAKLLQAFGIIKKPKPKKKQSGAGPGDVWEKLAARAKGQRPPKRYGRYGPFERRDVLDPWHEARGYPCRVCNRTSNAFHLPYGEDQVAEKLRQAQIEHLDRPIQQLLPFKTRHAIEQKHS